MKNKLHENTTKWTAPTTTVDDPKRKAVKAKALNNGYKMSSIISGLCSSVNCFRIYSVRLLWNAFSFAGIGEPNGMTMTHLVPSTRQTRSSSTHQIQISFLIPSFCQFCWSAPLLVPFIRASLIPVCRIIFAVLFAQQIKTVTQTHYFHFRCEWKTRKFELFCRSFRLSK